MTLSRTRFRLLVVSLLTVSILGALDHTIVSTSLATVAGSLGALGHMSWIIVGYTLASTVMLPVLGRLGDLVGPRAVFLWSVGLFLVASLACGFAQDMTWLIAARVVQGMSSSGMNLMSQTIIAQVTTPRERPKYMSIVGASFPIAILIGPVVGGLITDYWGWPWIFWINLPFGVVALAFAMVAIPRVQVSGSRSFDYAGSATLTVAIVGVVLGVTWMNDPGAAASAVAAYAVAAVALVAFFLVERRAAAPIVPLHRFRLRAVSAGVALAGVIGVGLFSVTAYLPTYFQMAYRTSATVSGLVPIATVFGMLLSNLLTGFLASRTGHYRVYPIAGTVLGAAGLLLMAVVPFGAPLWVPTVIMFGVGVGTGAFMSLVVAVVQSAVPRSETGAITATVNLVRQVGSTVATAVFGVVLAVGIAAGLPSGLDASRLTPQVVHASSAALQTEVGRLYTDVFAPIFVAVAVIYAAGVVAALLLPAGRLSDEGGAHTGAAEPVIA